MTARKDYNWAPPSLKHQGAAYLAGVNYVVAAENSVRVGTVVAGQADIARNIPAPTRRSSPLEASRCTPPRPTA